MAVFALIFAASVNLPAAAQQPGAIAPKAESATAATADDLEELLSVIEDAGERQRLIRRLKTLIEVQKGSRAEAPPTGLGARFITLLTDRIKETSEQLAGAADFLADTPKIGLWINHQFTDAEARGRWLEIIVKLLIVVALAYVARRITRLILNRPRRLIEGRETDNILIRLLFLAARTVVDLVPIAVFAAIAFAVLPVTEPGPETRVVVLGAVNAYIVIAALMAVGRSILVPAVSGLRVLPLADVNANYLFLWVRRFVYLIATGYFTAEVLLVLGMAEGVHRVLLNILGLLVAVMAVILILQNRAAVAAFIRGEAGAEEDRHGLKNLRERFADVWHALAGIYVVAIFAVWALRIEGGFEFVLRATVLTVIILAAARLLVFALRRAVNRGFALRPEIQVKFPSLEARANRYLPVLHSVLRAVVYVIAVLAVLGAWGIDSFAWIETALGRRILQSVISIAFVLLVAAVFWEAISAAIERYLAKTDGDGNQVERGARARTLLPLLRNAVFVILLVMVTLIVLAELGVNIGPLLAGAGVIGLALGIGSQKLVQDVITGVFILFEDSISVGDIVRVAGVAGVVEALSIRSIRLRDLSGRVHTIPFSAVDTVTNLTKEYSVYVFEIGVAYRENVDEVMAELKTLGTEIQADPEFRDEILEPLEVLGVDAFADSAVIIKARIRTKPSKQWMIGREFNRRIKNRFDELGIEIPFPHTTIYFGEDKDGGAPPVHVRQAARPVAPKRQNPRTEQAGSQSASRTEDGESGEAGVGADS